VNGWNKFAIVVALGTFTLLLFHHQMFRSYWTSGREAMRDISMLGLDMASFQARIDDLSIRLSRLETEVNRLAYGQQ